MKPEEVPINSLAKPRNRRRRSSRLQVTAEIRDWIKFACVRCECPELAEEIKCSFNGRLRRVVGRAILTSENDARVGGDIELATFFWPKLTEGGRRNIVIHEACHVICWTMFGSEAEEHGAHWKWLMRRCEVPPNKYLESCDLKEEFRPSDRHVPTGLVLASCGCTGHRKIHKYQARLIRAGETFPCDVCRHPIRLIYG